MLNRVLSLTFCLTLVVITVSFLPATVSAPRVPVIVAQLALTNQTGPIPQTTIFTPAQSGLYRVSSYIASTTPGQDDAFTATLVYTDDVALEYAALNNGSSGYYATSSGFTTFRATANNPVSFYTQGSTPQGTKYCVYLTIERLM
jgi:hypothetical protein